EPESRRSDRAGVPGLERLSQRLARLFQSVRGSESSRIPIEVGGGTGKCLSAFGTARCPTDPLANGHCVACIGEPHRHSAIGGGRVHPFRVSARPLVRRVLPVGSAGVPAVAETTTLAWRHDRDHFRSFLKHGWTLPALGASCPPARLNLRDWGARYHAGVNRR